MYDKGGSKSVKFSMTSFIDSPHWKMNFSALGNKNRTICIPLNPICYDNFPDFLLSYWEGPILITPDGQWWKTKGILPMKKKLMRQTLKHRVFNAWDIYSGPFASLWANFVLKIFPLFTFILGGQFLLPQGATNRGHSQMTSAERGREGVTQILTQ